MTILYVNASSIDGQAQRLDPKLSSELFRRFAQQDAKIGRLQSVALRMRSLMTQAGLSSHITMLEHALSYKGPQPS